MWLRIRRKLTEKQELKGLLREAAKEYRRKAEDYQRFATQCLRQAQAYEQRAKTL